MTHQIVPFLIDEDNYSYLIVSGGEAIVVDACSTVPVEHALRERNCTASLILSTHHHHDHTAGNSTLKKRYGCPVIGGDNRIPDLTHQCSDGEQITVTSLDIVCIATPGHTTGSFVFHLPALDALFTGDTLFYAGCGRCFEGTPQELHASLEKINLLPATTNVYCGHEYTLNNLAFAQSVEPENRKIKERIAFVTQSLAQRGIYGPSTIAEERATNPFLRCNVSAIGKRIGMIDIQEDRVFSELRSLKNNFRS